MAIYRLLQNAAFAPEDIAPLVAAYEDCLRTLKLSDRSDPTAQVLAKKIIATRQQDAPKNQRLEPDLLPRRSHWEAHGKQRERKSASLLAARPGRSRVYAHAM